LGATGQDSFGRKGFRDSVWWRGASEELELARNRASQAQRGLFGSEKLCRGQRVLAKPGAASVWPRWPRPLLHLPGLLRPLDLLVRPPGLLGPPGLLCRPRLP